MAGIIGRKIGMTQIFDDSGAAIPVTVVEAGPCPVVQVRSAEKEGYRAVQLGFGRKKPKRATKAEMGHAVKAGLEVAPAVLREFRLGDEDTFEPGEQVTVERFAAGTRVKVTGMTKGRGFQGVMKRHGFRGGPASHGATRIHRAPGSIGAGTNPSRVIKGKKLPGRMGGAQRTIRNLLIAKVDPDRNLLFIRGAIPGSNESYVFITEQ